MLATLVETPTSMDVRGPTLEAGTIHALRTEQGRNVADDRH